MIIKTQSFEIAVLARGDENSSKIALVLPGILDTKDYQHMTSLVDGLAHDGFYALSFDPPGTWDSPGSINLYTPLNYIKAVDEIIQLFGNKPTFVAGHSRGATISIASGCTNPNIYAFAAIMPSHIKGDYNGSEDLEWQENGVRSDLRDLPPGGGEKVKEFKLPYSFFEEQITYDYTEVLKNCAKPKLFIYGSEDTGSTPERVHQIYDVAIEPKNIFEIQSDHNYRLHNELISQVNKVVVDFVKSI